MPSHKAGISAFYSSSFLIFIIRFFPSLANLIVMLWYSRQLPVELYGRYSNFWILINVAYPLICFGTHTLILTYSKDVVGKLVKSINTKGYLLFAFWAVVVSSVFSWLIYSKSGIAFYVPFLFILSFSFSFILESVLIIFSNFKTLIITNVLFSVAYCAVHAMALKGDFSLDIIFSYLLVMSIIRLFVYVVGALRCIKNQDKLERTNTLPLFSDIRHLWIHLGIYDIVQNLSTWVDKFIVALLLTSGMSALYYNGSMNIPFLPVLLSAAGSSVLIQLARGDKKDEKLDTIALMNQSGRVLSCIVFPVFFFLFLYSHELFLILFTNKFKEAIPIFVVSLFVLPVRAYSFTTVLQRLHKGLLINIGAISEILLAIVLIYPLYRYFGLLGIALSFVISTWLQAGFYLVCSAKLLQVNVLRLLPFGNWFIKFIVFGSSFIGIHYLSGLLLKGKIVLFLGGFVMIALIAISLYFEFKLNKPTHVNPKSEI